MPTFYNFIDDGELEYSFDEVFIPADIFRAGTLWTWGRGIIGRLGTNDITDRSTPVTTFAGGTDWKQVSSGDFHTAAIKTDGTLWVWGNGFSGRLGTNSTSNRSTPVTTFAGGTNWKQVSSASSYTAAIKTDGTLWVWGNGGSGRLGTNDTTQRNTPVTTFAGGTDWKQVSSGGAHTAAIKTDGTLWTWGFGLSGRLGTNDTTNRSTPVTTFAGGTDWKQVSSASSHTAAIKTDGTLWTWGLGSNGRLGTNDTTDRSTPVTTFAGGTDWKQVSSIFRHIAAIKTDGTLWTWGNGVDGQLGVSYIPFSITPVTTFAGGTNWADTATGEPEELYTSSAGKQTTMAIKMDGTLWTWGAILGTNGVYGNTPVTTFAGGTNWKQIAAGAQGGCQGGIKTDGTLWTWGDGFYGQLGNATAYSFVETPITTFAGGTNWKQISCGGNHTVAIKTDGTLWTWGYERRGRLGNNAGDNNEISTPITTFAGGTNWKQVSNSYGVTAAIKTDGTLWTWGYGDGVIGHNSTSDSLTPITTFAGGTDWKQVSCGGAIRDSHTAAIKTDGTLWTWGHNGNGKLGTNDATDRSTPVTTFAGGTDWKQVSSGDFHTAAIKTDGTLWVWGNGAFGRLGTNDLSDRFTPVTTFAGGTNWKQVSSGDFHTVALRGDGDNIELYAFGSNSSDELGFPQIDQFKFTPITTFAGGTNWKQVSSGDRHTAAIKTDGTLWVWGNGAFGKLGNSTISTIGSLGTPVTTFAGGTNWKQVSSSSYGTVAVTYEDFVL